MYRDRNGVVWGLIPEGGGRFHGVPDPGSQRVYVPSPSRTVSVLTEGAAASLIEQYATSFAANVVDRGSGSGSLVLVALLALWLLTEGKRR
jgi:methylase of polypeptide subunit release factors